MAVLNFSTLSSLRSWAASLPVPSPLSTGCLQRSLAEGRFVASGSSNNCGEEDEKCFSSTYTNSRVIFFWVLHPGGNIWLRFLLWFRTKEGTWRKLLKGGVSSCGSSGSFPSLRLCHSFPFCGSGAAPAASTTVRPRAKTSAFGRLL